MDKNNKFKQSTQNGIILFLIVAVVVNFVIILKVSKPNGENEVIPKYQFSVILENDKDPYWNEFLEGAKSTSTENNISLDVSYTNGFTDHALIDKAHVASTDGIIAAIQHVEKCTNEINEASTSNIPSIVMGNDVPGSKRMSFLGSNAYLFGQLAGKEMTYALDGKGKILILINKDNKEQSEEQNLKISGFLSEINKHKALEVTEYVVTDNGIYGTSAVVDTILTKNKAIDGIFITNAMDTKLVTELLIEYNKVGKYQVVGTGFSEDIQSYIEKGIIYASVFVDSREMGKNAVKTMIQIKHNDPVPSYIETTIRVINRWNLTYFGE